MTSKLRQVVASPSFILYATAALAGITFLTGQYYDLTRTDWPGWLQAVGSVWAILVAVWVPWQQAEAQERREKQKEADELAGLLRLIRTELSNALGRAHDIFGPDLEALAPGEPFLIHLPVSTAPFTIYEALLPRLGSVRDDATRDRIVRTYGAATGFILTIQEHNKTLGAWHFSQTNGPAALTKKRFQELVNYSSVLQASYLEIKTEADKLFPLLR